MRRGADDSLVLDFGRFKGRTIRSLLNTPEGISYVRWLVNSNKRFVLKEAAKMELRKAGL